MNVPGGVRVSSFFTPLKILVAMTLVACLATISTNAFSAERERAQVNVKEVKRKKGKAAAPAQNSLKRSAVFAVQVERKLSEGIDATIKSLTRNAQRSPRKSASRLKRLSLILELHLEQAIYRRNEEERRYDKQWNEWDLGGRKGREPRLNTKNSRAQWQDVIKTSRQIMSEYPRSDNADQTLFSQAMALQYLGKEKESAKIYSQLIQKYPNSDVAGDAYSSLGDYFFDTNDFTNALNNYKKAAKYSRSSRYLWSVFKMGWCSYNLNRYEDALKYWKFLVKESRRNPKAEGANQLKEEALRDLVFAFAETKQVEPAIRYYQANGASKYIGSLLQLLSETFASQGQYKLAISTLKKFQKYEPVHADGPEAQKEVIALNYELGNIDQTWKELERFAAMFGPQSQWVKKFSSDKKRVLEVQQMVKDQLLYFSKLTHKRALDAESVPLHKEAEKGYIIFLQRYPKAKEVAEVKFNLADIKFFLKAYQKSGALYLDIVGLGKQKAVIYDPQGKKPKNIHRQAAEYMIESYAKDFAPEFKALVKTKPDFKKPPRTLSVKAKNYMKACREYKVHYPKDEKVVKICDLDTTQIFYRSNNKEIARRLLLGLAINYPQQKEGAESVELLIPLFSDNKSTLLSVVDKLLKVPNYKRGKLGKKLEGLKQSAQAENIEKEKDVLKRAKLYEKQALAVPNAAEVEKLWFNAAVNYLSAGDLAAAIRCYLILIKKFPKFSETKTAYIEVAGLYEKRFDFGAAASYYGAFASRYPKDKNAAGALSKSCDLLLAEGGQKATSVCLDFAKRYPEGGKSAVNRLILSAERSGRVSDLNRLIKSSYLGKFKLSANEKIIANYRIFKAYGKKGATASRAGSSILGVYRGSKGQVSGEALRYVGEILFRNAESKLAAFRNMKLVGGTVDRLAASVEKMSGALEALQAGYDQVLKSQDSYWGVAALYRKGASLEDFADKLSDPPSIKGAKKEDVLAQFQPKIDAVRKQAAQEFKFAFESVGKFHVYSEFSAAVVNKHLSASGSDMTFREFFPEPDFVGSPVASAIAKEVAK